MSYSPVTDFLGLLRTTSNGIRQEQMPGLDFVVQALARAGVINLVVGQTAPIANQATTAWFQPAVPSWLKEGALFLWNATTAQYQAATPALWAQLIQQNNGPYLFQSAPLAANTINPGVSLLAVQRAAPAATALTLPALTAQWVTGRKLQIVDFSTAVANHVITLTTPDGSTVMQQNTWKLQSTAAQLSGIMLQPSPDLNSWIVAP